MEFDDIKKIWDKQNNKPMYVISEQALHNRIHAKQRSALHTANVTELLSIMANLGAGGFVLAINLYKQADGIFMYILSGWMLIVAIILMVSRIRRIKGNRQFNRSVKNDLQFAISAATYQVQLSYLMWWNTLPVTLFVAIAIVEGGKSPWLVIAILIFFILVNYAARWEHNIYKARKRELEKLQHMLDETLL